MIGFSCWRMAHHGVGMIPWSPQANCRCLGGALKHLKETPRTVHQALVKKFQFWLVKVWILIWVGALVKAPSVRFYISMTLGAYIILPPFLLLINWVVGQIKRIPQKLASQAGGYLRQVNDSSMSYEFMINLSWWTIYDYAIQYMIIMHDQIWSYS